MSDTPVPRGSGRDEDPPGTPPGPGTPSGPGDYPELGSPDWTLVPDSPDWLPDEAYAHDDDDPGDLDEEYPDPDNAPPDDLDDAERHAVLVQARETAEAQARAAEVIGRLGHTGAFGAAASAVFGRRGPGQPGSADRVPGADGSPVAGFASGMPLDVASAGPGLASFLETAAGDDDRYAGAADDELLGVVCAWDRQENRSSARKHAAVAEFIRRRPAAGCEMEGPGQMPAGYEEFLAAELAPALGISRGEAGDMLALAYALEAQLPGTRAQFRAGLLSRAKVAIIAWAVQLLDPDEARRAEAMVLGRAARLTPGALKAAIAAAVMDVNADKARKRREHAAKRARVERWAEDSGNAGLAGRELPPAQVLAADQRVTAWAKELRKAGLDRDMDQLRARAYLDILLGTDSRPQPAAPDGADPVDGQDQDHPGPDDPGPSGSCDLFEPRSPAQAGPVAGMIPPGFAGRVNLTTPLTTLLGLADRPGELTGIGPVDPGLARDLAAAAARNPRSTWCLTVTDGQGHAIGHGCARPAPASKTRLSDKPRGGSDPPGTPSFTFTPADQPGPPGGYGTWRFTTGIPGQRGLLIRIGPIPAAGDCDHRHQAKGHDPGVMLRHLTEVRHATCTGPGCRRPAARCDFEHNIPYEAGGRTCLCNGNPKCRHDHRLKQDPRWNAEQLPDGSVRWTTPTGRQYTTEPTRYPI